MSGDGFKATPWKNGFYRMKGFPSSIFTIIGETVKIENVSGRATNQDNDPNSNGTLKFGDFGEAHTDVAKEAGKKKYDVDIYIWGGVFPQKGIVNDDGTKIFFWGMGNAVDCLQWESEESMMEYRKSGDPVEAPPSHYKIQPENQGKLLFISGAPGLGKSTTGLLLSRKAGYVYYEGDCFWAHLNPYLPPELEEPSTEGFATQNFLKGVSQERIDAAVNAESEFDALTKGEVTGTENLCKVFSEMAKNIEKERKRLGGDWAVTFAVPTRKLRDHIRAELGPDLIFVVLHMTKEDQEARVKGRHGEEAGGINDYLMKAYSIYEPAAEDEPNTLDVRVTPEMTKNDVVDKILNTLKQK